MSARADEIKAELSARIEANMDSVNEGTVVSIALLEMAIHRYIDLHGEQDAHFLIESAFRRALDGLKVKVSTNLRRPLK
jgi:hypothetical protein